MANKAPMFLARIFIAFGVFFRYIFSSRYAAGVHAVSRKLAAGPEAAVQPGPSLAEVNPDAALQLLGLLQREGRLIDFLQEDTSRYSDADIGAAARVVHAGCQKVLREYFSIDPVRAEEEGARVTLESGFDPAAVRLVGNVVGEPPFTGALTHRGWRASDIRLPKVAVGHGMNVITPAEVEL